MTKKQSKIKFTLFAIFAAICIFLTCFTFSMPFTTYNYVGFLKAIALDQEFGDGRVIIYEANAKDENNSELENKVELTIEKLNQFLLDYGYTGINIYKQNSDKIRLELPKSEYSDVFDVIGSPSPISIRRAENDPNEITAEDIKDAYGYEQQTSATASTWGVVIEFTEAGKTKFFNLTTEAAADSENKTISIYIGGNLYSSPSVSEAMSDGVTFITGSDITSSATADTFAMKVLSGGFPTTLELVFDEEVSAILGEYGLLLALISICAIVVASFIYLIFKYGINGIMASFALVFFFCIYAFLLQVVPIVYLSIGGLLGIVLSFAVLVITHIFILDNIKKEYALGKKIPASIKAGFKNSFMTVFDIHIIIAILSIGLYFLGTSPIKDFSMATLLGMVASLFTSYVLTREFINSYLPLNSTKAKAYKFVREVEADDKN